MQFNQFYHTGAFFFREMHSRLSQNILSSFWTGSSFQHFVSFYSPGHFFSDSLHYSLNRLKEIKEDIAINPVSPNFDKTVSQSRFSFKKFLLVGASTFALQMAATSLHQQNEDTQFNQQQLSSLPSNTSNTSQHIQPSLIAKKNSFSTFLQQSIYNSNPVFSLHSDIATSSAQIPHYMQSMFSSKDKAFLQLLKVAEGVQYKFYRDNKGLAIAHGWNPTRNSLEFNLKIAQAADLDDTQTSAIIRLSNTNKINFVPKDLKKISLSQEQVQKVSLALMPHYEQGFLNAMTSHSLRNGRNPDKDISAYHSLPNNQQVVMIHMAYKVGAENLLNYKTFYKKLFSYFDKPNKNNLSQVQQNFTYTYANLDGTRLHDTRVENIHTSFFSDCAIVSQPQPNDKNKVLSKINQCRNIAHLDKSDTQSLHSHVATIQTKMSSFFG